MAEIDQSVLDELLALNSWLTGGILDAYVDSFIAGDQEVISLAKARATDDYRAKFAGNTAADGSTRMDENSYLAYQEAFVRKFEVDLNLNVENFADSFAALVEGGVSYSEFNSRVTQLQSQVLLGSEALRATYAEYQGASGISNEELLAAALDPSLEPAIFARQIQVAKVGAAGVQRLFRVSIDQSNRLFNAGIDTGSEAAELFDRAACLIPTIDRLAERHNDPDDDLSLDEFIDSDVFADQEQRNRIRNLFAAENSLFTDTAAVRQTREGARTGLQER